ncbi:MAG: glycosyltransferase family 2 protein [Candidatus Aegiribacteria sp.]
MDLSLVITARNEERDIERCIRSVPFADRVIVVDSGSSDSTVEVARSLGARVYSHEFTGFSSQKQWAADRAETGWILALDADEYLNPELAGEIPGAIAKDEDYNGYTLPFRVLYMGRLMRFGPWSGERHLRLFRKGMARYGSSSVHEGLVLEEGRPGHLKNGFVVHESYSSVTEQVDKMKEYAVLWASERSGRGEASSWHRIALRPFWRFFSGYFLRGGFLEGVPGLAASAVSAYYVLLKWLLLYEKGRQQ